MSCQNLCTRKEDQWFERKSVRIAAKDLATAITAFANADGGTIAVGIEDRQPDHYIDTGKFNEIRQIGLDHTNPSVTYKVFPLECQGPNGASTVVVIDVPPSEHVHRVNNGNCYLRVGDETKKLSFDDQLELNYTKGEMQFDSTIVRRATTSDLNFEAVGASNPRSALRGRHLVSSSDEPTVASILLFGNDPHEFFINADVRVLRWSSTERTTGSRQTLASDTRIVGRIPDVIERATEQIRLELPREKQLGANQLFDWHPLLPEDGWREGLVNAVLHRSYSINGDDIRVEIFPDRLEITSPGRFPGLADARDPLSISRSARNPLIARAAIALGIGQELGKGIRRMFTEMRSAGFSDPEFRQTSGQVILILRAQSAIPAAELDDFPAHSKLVLQVLRNADRPLSTGEISSDAGVNRVAVKRALVALRDAGLIRWSGKSLTDPRATWTVEHPLRS